MSSVDPSWKTGGFTLFGPGRMSTWKSTYLVEVSFFLQLDPNTQIPCNSVSFCGNTHFSDFERQSIEGYFRP